MLRLVSRRALAALAAPAALAAAGCGVPPQVRADARVLALYTQSVQRQTERFAEARDVVARARVRNLAALEESALAAEQELATSALTWRLAGDDVRLKLYQGVLEGTALAEQQARALAAQRDAHARQIAAARGATSVRSAQLANTAQALAQLARRPAVQADAEFYAGFVRSVRRSLDESKAAVDRQAQQAADEASAKQPQKAGAAQ